MTTFETLVAELGRTLDIDLGPDSDGIAQIAVEERVVLLRPEGNGERATLFTALASLPDAEAGAAARQKLLERALSLDLFGRDTLGGHVGLFVDTLLLSRDLPLAGLSAEDLADHLAAFARLANDLAGRLEDASPAAPSGDAPAPFGPDLLRI